MIHERSSLAEFQEGERRFVYASYRSNDVGVYRLEDGAANAARAFVKAELLCPVPSCPSPALTTVSRHKHRDHFKHLQGNFGHAAESYFHVEAKAQIAAWVRGRYPTATVVLEQPSNAKMERIADVMVTMASGERIAIEIQYSKLPHEQWRERHLSYRAQGIRDVWLFGHIGDQIRVERDRVEIGETQEIAAEAGCPILWFNPLTLLVGTAVTPAPFPYATYEGSGTFLALPLDRFTLDPVHGLSHPTIRAHLASAANHRQRIAELAAQHAREETQAAAARAKARAASERAEEAAARAAQTRAEMLDAWLLSAEGRTMNDRFPEWPDYLNVDTTLELPVPRQMWQAYLLVNLVERVEPGARVSIRDASTSLRKDFDVSTDPQTLHKALEQFFAGLVKARILTKLVKRHHYGTRTIVSFQRAQRVTPIVPDEQMRPGAPDPVRHLSKRGYLTETDLLASAATSSMQTHAKGRLCETCGMPMERMLPGRFHIGPCDPERRVRR